MTQSSEIEAPIPVEALRVADVEFDVVEIESQLWFVASTAARKLGYRDGHALSRTQNDEGRTALVRTSGGVQRVALIAEADFYGVIFAARSEKATELREWLLGVALPNARKSGVMKMLASAHSLGVTLNFTPSQWEWLTDYRQNFMDIIPYAAAGYDGVEISRLLGYKTVNGITARKQIARLKELGFLPQVIEPRVKQLERRIKAERSAQAAP